MNKYKFLIMLACALSQLACSTNSDEGINYQDSVITPTLEIPPDLIGRESGKNLVLPGSKVGTKDNAGRFVETGNLNSGNESKQ